jgi:hypothetical protein
MSVGQLIQVGHLIKACDGDGEKLAGLAVLVSLASCAMTMTRDPTPVMYEQVKLWAAAIEDIHRELIRGATH